MHIRAIGNAGFVIDCGGRRVFIDAFYRHNPNVGSAPLPAAAPPGPADLVLVTHLHGDHYAEDDILSAQHRGRCAVAGPDTVTRRLAGRVPPPHLLRLEPDLDGAPDGGTAETTAEIAGVRVTAFRTTHTRDHNSYLVEGAGRRVFHDGDNENTRLLPVGRLTGLDALFIATWRGAHWVKFVEAVRPRHWFLMHLTEAEIEDARSGRYFPDLCDHVPLPERLVVLAPGESFVLPG